MEIKNFEELEDGGAQFELDLTNEEVKSLLSYAINKILKELIENETDIEN